jgi:hypothetical protein
MKGRPRASPAVVFWAAVDAAPLLNGDSPENGSSTLLVDLAYPNPPDWYPPRLPVPTLLSAISGPESGRSDRARDAHSVRRLQTTGLTTQSLKQKEARSASPVDSSLARQSGHPGRSFTGWHWPSQTPLKQ